MTEFTDENVKNFIIFNLLNKIGFVVEDKAKQLCPVDTGRLRASIQHKILPEELAVVIGTNVPYAPYVEYMYPVNAPHPGRETGQMPFLRPALFQLKDKINRMIKEAFGGK
jgi:phage gpG-like protein